MRYISFRYAVNGPTKPQEALSNHEAKYFRQSQASLFWPHTAAANAYKKALAGNLAIPDDFRAAITALRSLDVSKGVSFHTFSLPEDRCVHLLVKNLGTRMPDSIVKEELEALGICVQGVLQLRSGRRDPDPEKDRPVTPPFIVSVARGPEAAKVRSVTQLCGLA